MHLNQNESVVKKLLSRLQMYPIILLICFGPSFLHRIYYIIENKENFWINIIAGSLGALYGFVNAIVYGLTSKVKKTIGSAINKLFSPNHESTVSTGLLE